MTELSKSQQKKNKALAHNVKYANQEPLTPFLVDVTQHLTGDPFQDMMVRKRQAYLADYSLVGIHKHKNNKVVSDLSGQPIDGKPVPDQFHLRKIFKPTSKYLGNGQLRA